MKFKETTILLVTLLSILVISCNTSTDPAVVYASWKLKNETYFTNMKDSTGYVYYKIPTELGGSGYYYKITTPGDSTSGSPSGNDLVSVNYRGTVINGGIFDQTYKGTGAMIDSTATPLTFYTNQLIAGWTYNLMQMKTGEKRTVVIPQELGYGSTGAGYIAPYSTLIFNIQLISFHHAN